MREAARPGSASPLQDVWLKAQSKHFTLIGNASEKDIRGVAMRLEQFREAFLQLFPPLAVNSSIPVTVIVFKDDSAYRPFKPLYEGKPADLSGYFQSSGDTAYITMAAGHGDANPYAVIFHEYVHALISGGAHPARVALPVWLSEGVAEYFSAFELTGDGKKVWLGKRSQAASDFCASRRLCRCKLSSPLITTRRITTRPTRRIFFTPSRGR